MKTRSEILDLRLYIEGKRVPCMGATVTYAVEQSATAFVQIQATDAAYGLRPRSVVEIYFRDTEEPPTSATVPRSAYVGQKVVKKFVKIPGMSSEEIEQSRYKLLFIGELAGYTFFMDTNTRVINLMCMDFGNHYDNMMQYIYDANNASNQALTLRTGVLSGANAPEEYTFRDLHKPEITRVDATEAATAKRVESLNVQAGQVLGLDQYLASVMGTYGLSDGLKVIFESVSRNYSYYRGLDAELGLRDQLYCADDDLTAELYRSQVFLELILGMQNRMGSMNTLRNLIRAVFRVSRFEFVSLPGSPFYSLKDYDEVFAKIAGSPASAGAPQLKILKTDVTKFVPGFKTMLLKPELHFAEPPACNIVFPDEVYSINVSRHFLAEPTRGVTYTDHVATSLASGEDIEGITNSFMIAPAITIDGSGNITSYTPKEMFDVVNGTVEGNFGNKLLPEEVLKGIMPVHTNISHYERSSYLAALRGTSGLGDAQKELTRLVAEPKKSGVSAGDASGSGVVDTYRQYFIHDSNYRFLEARYGRRTANVSCKFLPRLVPGFTSLVMDKSVTLSSLEGDRSYVGHIGHIAALTHTISQSGALTTAQMTHVRPTNEVLDFFTSKPPKLDDRGPTIFKVFTGVTTISPDYRIMGVMPWAKDVYGPEKIVSKYIEWLGGVGSAGEGVGFNIDRPYVLGSRDIVGSYLGVLPLTVAICDQRSHVGGIASAQRDNVVENFMAILKVFTRDYLQRVTHDPHVGAHVEAFAENLVRRPMATLLQVRGYLNSKDDSLINSGAPADIQTRNGVRRQAVDTYLKSIESMKIEGHEIGGAIRG